ncbi:arginine repressor [Calidifontibacter sp. DB0510]|uniref:Arginine repressor n=1 Tax=Metallococcus carri TaxID=1656884 RepID=A0A967B4I0_9MICO|nr:arginine repressor [Metallococcus carri]NHN57388.1 arginine repressor [Metallococcus carri]NOP39216.1 arginine repressor [Calidifontibacter sp. DB2511S]
MMTQTRTARHRMIVEVLNERPVRSQSELAEHIAAQGFSVTQATLSRDLVELGAIKVRRDGQQVYAVPQEGGDGSVPAATQDAAGRLRRLATELLVAARTAENLVVLRTPPGGANLLASAIDHANLPDIVGTIAGDDTVAVIAASRTAAPQVAQALLDLVDTREE